jgi:hypothetical protein
MMEILVIFRLCLRRYKDFIEEKLKYVSIVSFTLGVRENFSCFFTEYPRKQLAFQQIMEEVREYSGFPGCR